VQQPLFVDATGNRRELDDVVPELTANHQVTGFRVLSGHAKSFLLLTGEPLFGISLREMWVVPSIPDKA
jgi:hypothetical protein